MGSFQLLAICDINLAYFDACLLVFYQKDSIFTCCLCLFSIDCSVCFQYKCSVCGYSISIRCYRLTQGISLSCLQSGYFMRFLRGIPFLNYITILVKDLDMGSFEFLAICNINLADFDRCNGVGDGVKSIRIFLNSSYICRKPIFCNSILNFFSIFILRQIFKLPSPFTICIWFYFFTFFFCSICK